MSTGNYSLVGVGDQRGEKVGLLDSVVRCLQHRGGLEFSDSVMDVAANKGQEYLHVVRGLRGGGYRWSAQIVSRAASGGHLELCNLKWCLLNGCPWSRSEGVRVVEYYERGGGDFAVWRDDDGRFEVLEWWNKVGGKVLWMTSRYPWWL